MIEEVLTNEVKNTKLYINKYYNTICINKVSITAC